MILDYSLKYKNAIISVLQNLDLRFFYFEVAYVKNNIPAFFYQGKLKAETIFSIKSPK